MYVWGEITEVAKQMHRIYKIPQSSRMWSSCWQCTLQCAYSIFIVIICILEVLLGLPFLAHGILLTHYLSASKKFIEWNRRVFLPELLYIQFSSPDVTAGITFGSYTEILPEYIWRVKWRKDREYQVWHGQQIFWF